MCIRDSYFTTKQLAVEFITFMKSVMLFQQKQTISFEDKSELCTITLRLPSLSKGDLVALPQTLQRKSRHTSLCLVTSVNAMIHLFDLTKRQMFKLCGSSYWQCEPLPSYANKELSEYVVLAVQVLTKSRSDSCFMMLLKDKMERQKVGIACCMNTVELRDRVLGYELDGKEEHFCKKVIRANVVVVKKVFAANKEVKLERLNKIIENTREQGTEEEYKDFVSELEAETVKRQSKSKKKEHKVRYKKESDDTSSESELEVRTRKDSLEIVEGNRFKGLINEDD
eukprot:TRINITY_DN7940_c0_g1_i9.p1 TRINITY_DN7940_c0_g1~~TRINITY_DN7940_c0_g1_i9.p1  ORF type:complete len:283 (+),score=58.69 TRINITY_DN7940_c0_g1_i9:76-924(+)